MRIKSQDVVRHRKRGFFRSWWKSAGSLNDLRSHYLEERKERKKRLPSDDATANEVKLEQGTVTYRTKDKPKLLTELYTVANIAISI